MKDAERVICLRLSPWLPSCESDVIDGVTCEMDLSRKPKHDMDGHLIPARHNGRLRGPPRAREVLGDVKSTSLEDTGEGTEDFAKFRITL
jgi:hypothetical protein